MVRFGFFLLYNVGGAINYFFAICPLKFVLARAKFSVELFFRFYFCIFIKNKMFRCDQTSEIELNQIEKDQFDLDVDNML